jgi:hypothetical protein
MPLFKARVTIEVVFWAEDVDHAWERSSDATGHQIRDNGLDGAQVDVNPVNSVGDLPDNWSIATPYFLPEENEYQTCARFLREDD